MDDEQRALEGAAKRTPTAPIASENEAAPAEPYPDEDTSPFELLCDALADDEIIDVQKICDELGVDPESPATIKQVFKLARRQNRKSGAIRAAANRAANSAVKVAGAKTPPLDRLAAMERKVKVLWWVLSVAITLVTANIVAVAKSLYGRGFDEGALMLRLEHQERDLERMRLEIRDFERAYRRRSQPSSSAAPAAMPNPVASKGLLL